MREMGFDFPASVVIVVLICLSFVLVLLWVLGMFRAYQSAGRLVGIYMISLGWIQSRIFRKKGKPHGWYGRFGIFAWISSLSRGVSRFFSVIGPVLLMRERHTCLDQRVVVTGCLQFRI